MKIGIDCRLWNESGVGRYIRNLVIALGSLDRRNEYVLFLLPGDIKDERIPARFKKVSADVPWHTLREQVAMPKIFLRETLDVLHIPYVNAPLFYPKRFVITVHDLTPIKYPTPKASKLPAFSYALKLLFYYLVLFFGVRKSSKVIAVSEATRRDVMGIFRLKSDKIEVCYNFNLNFKCSKPAEHRENYILYVGNAYPHKNLQRLVKAYEIFMGLCKEKAAILPDLVLVGREDYFYDKLKRELPVAVKPRIIFEGFVEDARLEELYSKALFVIQPSLYEGFGFQLLEAFSAGNLVLCSDIPVFRELAGDAVVYFDPRSSEDMAQKLFLGMSMPDSERLEYIIKGQKTLFHFSPDREVKKVLEIYKGNNI